MLTPETLIRRPIILTEKSNRLREGNQVIFEVAPTANKIQIKDAIQKLFKVTVATSHHEYAAKSDDGRGYGKLKTGRMRSHPPEGDRFSSSIRGYTLAPLPRSTSRIKVQNGIKSVKPTRRARFYSVSISPKSPSRPERACSPTALDRRAQHHGASPALRGGGHKQRYASSISGARSRRAGRVAAVESSQPHGALALLTYADGEKR